MKFHLDTQYHLIINNRLMQVIKLTIRQVMLQADKEFTLKNGRRCFEKTLNGYQLELVLVFAETKEG